MNKINSIYKTLLKTYNHQNWWPTTLENNLHPTHHGKGISSEKDIFEIIIGAILTQNTSWTNVEKAIGNLNKNNLLEINKIININQQKLAEIIRSAGYYNQKAERLKIIANFLKQNNIQTLKQKPINELRQTLLNIKGIGKETADSIILYAFEKPIFVIDAYTRRIFSRLKLINETEEYDNIQGLFHNNLEPDSKVFNEYHALIVEHAKRSCKTKPVCKDCVLENVCVKNI